MKEPHETGCTCSTECVLRARVAELEAHRDAILADRLESDCLHIDVRAERDDARKDAAALRAGLESVRECCLAGHSDAAKVALINALLASPSPGEGWVSPEAVAGVRAALEIAVMEFKRRGQSPWLALDVCESALAKLPKEES